MSTYILLIGGFLVVICAILVACLYEKLRSH